MSKNLFVYGTLMFDEIIIALTGQKFKSSPATLQDYQRHNVLIKGETANYPGIKKDSGHTINGKILFGLTDESSDIIEAYENTPPEYKKTVVKVTTKDDEMHLANTYIALPHITLQGTWDPEHFKKHHLETYVNQHIPQILKNITKEH